MIYFLSNAVVSGDKFSIDGKHTLALNAWRDQLKRYQGTIIIIIGLNSCCYAS